MGKGMISPLTDRPEPSWGRVIGVLHIIFLKNKELLLAEIGHAGKTQEEKTSPDPPLEGGPLESLADLVGHGAWRKKQRIII